MRKRIKELSRRAAFGETEALIALSRGADESKNDREIELYVNAFDDAAVLYAMGRSKDEFVEWEMFREIARKSHELEEYAMEANRCKESLIRNEFEIEVIKKMLGLYEVKGMYDLVTQRLEESKYGPEMIKHELAEAEREVEYLTVWLKEARKKLTHKRFTSLPDDVFDELVDVVAYELFETDQREEGECEQYLHEK